MKVNDTHYKFHEIDSIAQNLLKLLNGCRIMTFEGQLGAGKTTLIRSMLRKMGVKEIISSPTFTYVNIFRLASGKTIYHFDLYRISSVEEFVMAGFDEYLHDENSYVFIEWPKVIEPLLSKVATCSVHLEHLSENERLLTVA